MIRLNRPLCPNPAALLGDYRHRDNKDALRSASFDKCMYCESKVSQTYYGDIEHIKPKSKFPALEFVWENLGYVCARCNGAKSDTWSDQTPFVNPYDEAPDDHLVALGPLLRHRNGSERGELTWRVIDLNRIDLVARRMERIDAIQTLVDKIAKTSDPALRVLLQAELQKEIGEDKPYALVARAAAHALA